MDLINNIKESLIKIFLYFQRLPPVKQMNSNVKPATPVFLPDGNVMKNQTVQTVKMKKMKPAVSVT